MLFFVLERFRSGQAGQIYERLRRRGRMLPDNVRYVDSWVDTSFSRCFQVMEAPNQEALDAWMAEWEDLVEFECLQVYTGAEAFAMAADWESRKHLAPPPRFKPRQWTRRHGETVAEHIIQSEDHWFDAAVTIRGEPTRLIGGAPSREGAELIAKRQLDALDHDRCCSQCEGEWKEVVDHLADRRDTESNPGAAHP
jgi:hypothetical protein